MRGSMPGEDSSPSISGKLTVLPEEEIDARLEISSGSDLRGSVSMMPFGVGEESFLSLLARTSEMKAAHS